MCLQLSVYSNPWIPCDTGWGAAQETELTLVFPNQMTSTYVLADKHKQREVSNLF